MTFYFEHFDGNAGTVSSFDTEADAIEEAERVWSHLSDTDRCRYSSTEDGACFYVCDDDNTVVQDWVVA